MLAAALGKEQKREEDNDETECVGTDNGNYLRGKVSLFIKNYRQGATGREMRGPKVGRGDVNSVREDNDSGRGRVGNPSTDKNQSGDGICGYLMYWTGLHHAREKISKK